ncbi:MAG: hypothetical protein H0U11_00035, partial [Chloroflexi bacterium]|nr:hypothetical protein [Chloroflexota bacterium]
MTMEERWRGPWRGRWIWDHAPEEAFWWKSTGTEAHSVLLRHTFTVAEVPQDLPVRVTCDSRYELYLNGGFVGRGPIRSEPEHLGWDEHDLAPH